MVPFMRDELQTILNQLLHVIFRKDALDKADTPLTRLNKKWLTKTKHYLEDGLVDLGLANKYLLEKVQTSAERKRKCEQLVLDLVLEFRRKSPLKFCFVRNTSCLAPKTWSGNRNKVASVSDPLLTMMLIKQITSMINYWTWWNMRRTINFTTSTLRKTD